MAFALFAINEAVLKRSAFAVICITSPVTRCSKTRDNSAITSVFRKLASVTDALARRKSPAKMASLFPTSKFSARNPRRVAAWSKTSSCSSDAT
eukprot:23269-Pelagococcus_subviridis.AAC.2